MQIRQAISARLDGEDAGLDETVVYGHLAQCPECRDFAHGVEDLHRTVRLAPAPEIPDLTPSILAAIGSESLRADPVGIEAVAHDADTQRVLRWVLVAIAVVQIAIAVPALFGSDAGLPVHTARHIGSFDIALAVGFLFAAWRPSRIPGLLPVVVALVICLLGTSLLDVAAGNTAALGESQHITDFAGLAVVWLLSRPVLRPVRLA